MHVSLLDYVLRDIPVGIELLHDSMVALRGLHPPNVMV